MATIYLSWNLVPIIRNTNDNSGDDNDAVCVSHTLMWKEPMDVNAGNDNDSMADERSSVHSSCTSTNTGISITVRS